MAQVGAELRLEGYSFLRYEVKHYVDTISSTDNSEVLIRFTNVGDEVLIISDVRGSDPCYAFDKSLAPIAPGDTGVFVLRCPTLHTGRLSTTFMIYSNATPTSDTRFTISRWFKD
jgi:hypothetical protein